MGIVGTRCAMSCESQCDRRCHISAKARKPKTQSPKGTHFPLSVLVVIVIVICICFMFCGRRGCTIGVHGVRWNSGALGESGGQGRRPPLPPRQSTALYRGRTQPAPPPLLPPSWYAWPPQELRGALVAGAAAEAAASITFERSSSSHPSCPRPPCLLPSSSSSSSSLPPALVLVLVFVLLPHSRFPSGRARPASFASFASWLFASHTKRSFLLYRLGPAQKEKGLQPDRGCSRCLPPCLLSQLLDRLF
jgi:hypothetical protein